MLDAGLAHALMLLPDGTVKSWGNNNFGQLGRPSGSSGIPTQIPGLTGVVAVACGRDFSLALAVNSGVTKVYGWGYNGGALGLGTLLPANAPTEITSLQGAAPVIAMAAGRFTTYFLKADGTVWACGSNLSGQLGQGNVIMSSTPVQVPIPAFITSMAAGDFHAFALDNAGNAWCWGQNTNYALGTGTNTNVLSPMLHPSLSGVSAVAAGQVHTLAMLQDGTVKCMGGGSSVQLGTGATTNRMTPDNVTAITACQAVFAGAEQSFIIQNNGAVMAFGKNTYGQLGNGASGTPVLTPTSILALCNQGPALALALAPAGSNHVIMTLSCNGTVGATPLGYFNAFSINPSNVSAPGTGWWHGLHIDASEITEWVTLASAGEPFCFGPMASWGAAATFPVAPSALSGITIHGVSVLINSGGVVESSPVMSRTF